MKKYIIEPLQDLACGLTVVSSVTISCALALAVVWAVADYCRNFPTGHFLLPIVDSPVVKGVVLEAETDNPIEIVTVRVINAYNFEFPGANRLGSGMGLIIGSLWSLSMIKKRRWLTRFLCRALVGTAVGIRAAMMLSSNWKYLLGCGSAGLAMAVLMTIVDLRPRRYEPLPLIDIETGDV